VVTIGRLVYRGEWAFWDVHDPDKAIAIHLHDEPYAKLVIGVDDPAGVDGAVLQLRRGHRGAASRHQLRLPPAHGDRAALGLRSGASQRPCGLANGIPSPGGHPSDPTELTEILDSDEATQPDRGE
jgi:hypothetical protein